MTPPQACERWIERLSAYADGECGPAERLLVWWHLLRCAHCRRWLADVRENARTFSDAFLQSARGADITAGVMQEVSKMKEQEVIRPVRARKAATGRLIEVFAVLAMLAVLAAVLFPVFAKSHEKARQSSCMSNLKQLALGTIQFANEHEDHLPGAITWQEDIMPYVKNKMLFVCPDQKTISYAINPHVAGRKLDDIPDKETTVLLYEADEHGQPDFPHNDGANYAFVDGHVKWLSKRDQPEDLQTSGFVPPERNYGLAQRLRIAYQASVEVVVENLYQSLLQAEAAVTKCGGFLMESNLAYCGRHGQASLVVKVPTEQVGNCINALGALGFVASRQITGEDLTRQYVTTTRDIGAHTEREQRLSNMVQTMGDDRQRVAAEQNLGETETATTALRDSAFDIDTRTTLATVSATLTERAPRAEVVRPDVPAAFGSAVSSLWTLALRIGSVLAWVLVFAPVWGAALAAGLIAFRLLRRGR